MLYKRNRLYRLQKRTVYFKTAPVVEEETEDEEAEQDDDEEEEADDANTGDPKNQAKAKTEKTFTQAELDAIVQERLAKEKRKAERDKQKAAEQELESAKEFETLAKQRGEALAEAEHQVETLTAERDSFKTERDAYASVVQTLLAEQRKGLAKPVIALLDELTPLKQLDWLAKNKGELEKGELKGVPRTPKASGTGITEAKKGQAERSAQHFYRGSF